jgi:hypothetical protein
MPQRLTLDDRTLLAATGAAALALVALAVVLGGSASGPDVPTTYSTSSSGSRALYQLLEASHYSVGRWERPLGDLPNGSGVTLIVAEPENNPTADDRKALERFVGEGGRVIATGLSGPFFLPTRRVSADPVAGLTWKHIPSSAPSLETRAAPNITLAPRAYWDDDAFGVALYRDGDKTRVAKYGIGAGEVTWWAAPTPITNAGVSQPGNLEFVLASLGDGHRQILWDEYVHGHRQAVPGSFISSPLGWLGGQLALLTAVVLLTYSRRSGPIVAAPAASRLSSIEFVRTLSALYRRAGAASIAVDIAYQQFRHRLTQRLGIAGTTSTDELQRAARSRWPLDDHTFGALLQACDTARGDPALKASRALELTQSLWDCSRTLDQSRFSGKESA